MALTLEYGKCASCGRENSKTLQQCRGCNAVLPWVKGAKSARSAVPDSQRLGGTDSAPKQKIGAGDVAWGGIGVGLVGGLVVVLGAFLWCGNVFGFFPTFPMVGYITMAIGGAIWRFGSAMDD